MNLHELNLDARPAPEGGAEVCESCGAEFRCGASQAGCWCAEVELDGAARAELRERFRRCLCRACLEGYAAGGGLKSDV